MNRIPVYGLCPRVVRSFPCTHKYLKWVATHPWNVVLSVITYTMLTMAWWLYRFSCRIWGWFHSFGNLWLGWMASQCIDCIPVLSDLYNEPIRHMSWVTTHSWPAVLSNNNNTHQHYDGMVVLQILSNLVPQLWCALWLGWMSSHGIDCVPGFAYPVHAPTRYVEWLAIHPWLVVSCNNTHHCDDGMVVL